MAKPGRSRCSRIEEGGTRKKVSFGSPTTTALPQGRRDNEGAAEKHIPPGQWQFGRNMIGLFRASVPAVSVGSSSPELERLFGS